MPTEPHPGETAPKPASHRDGKIEHDDRIASHPWRLLDRPSAAVVLGIGLRLLDQLTSCEAIPSVCIGRRRLYREDHILAWLDAGAPQKPGSASRVLRDLRRGGGR